MRRPAEKPQRSRRGVLVGVLLGGAAVIGATVYGRSRHGRAGGSDGAGGVQAAAASPTAELHDRANLAKSDPRLNAADVGGTPATAMASALAPPDANAARAAELVRLARRYRQAEQWPPAVETLEEAIRIGPYDEDLHYELGSWMEMRAPASVMIDYWSEEAKTDPKPQTAYYYWAEGLERAGDDAGALAKLAQALAIDPAHELSELRIAKILERQGKHEPALAHCLAATRIFPDFRQAHEFCAEIYGALGRRADAARETELASKSDPTTPRRYLYWARYLADKGRMAAARAELARALAQNPNDSEARALESKLGAQ